MDNNILLRIEDLKVHFLTDRGKVTAVDGVSFSVAPKEIIGIVGESGCGKSVMVQSILRLLEHTEAVKYSGQILYDNKNILESPLSDIRKIRGNDISIIFQDPQTSLNPVYTVGNQIDEVQILHKKVSEAEARKRSIELLHLTGIKDPKQCVKQYPFELSGGMQQRAMIAMALACEPKLLIADEPTTALDVTIQAQILDLIVEINERMGMAVLFITHDLGVVSEICTSVKVMYLGQIVEETKTDMLFERPLHPYTQGLIKSIPRFDGNREDKLNVIEGVVPSLYDVPKGCRFSTRCPYADEKCILEEPPLMETDDINHRVKCWYYKEVEQGLRVKEEGEKPNV
ncbi:ABC transporter ATP-binding protein [Tissierella creatinini]|nr:ABC transporter ATP-binding protein [Tissierella creatinini]TJX64153.1 ABC transporter ATP-binding protein [Soehngenia saccharolytica]